MQDFIRQASGVHNPSVALALLSFGSLSRLCALRLLGTLTRPASGQSRSKISGAPSSPKVLPRTRRRCTRTSHFRGLPAAHGESWCATPHSSRVRPSIIVVPWARHCVGAGPCCVTALHGPRHAEGWCGGLHSAVGCADVVVSWCRTKASGAGRPEGFGSNGMQTQRAGRRCELWGQEKQRGYARGWLFGVFEERPWMAPRTLQQMHCTERCTSPTVAWPVVVGSLQPST